MFHLALAGCFRCIIDPGVYFMILHVLNIRSRLIGVHLGKQVCRAPVQAVLEA